MCSTHAETKICLPADREKIRGKVIRSWPEGNWGSLIFVVPKKRPGEYKLVNYFQKVNEQIILGYLPSNKITDMFSEVQVCGAKTFSAVDLQSSFFSIAPDHINSEITAFFADCGNNISLWGENLTCRSNYDRLVMDVKIVAACLIRQWRKR